MAESDKNIYSSISITIKFEYYILLVIIQYSLVTTTSLKCFLLIIQHAIVKPVLNISHCQLVGKDILVKFESYQNL